MCIRFLEKGTRKVISGFMAKVTCNWVINVYVPILTFRNIAYSKERRFA